MRAAVPHRRADPGALPAPAVPAAEDQEIVGPYQRPARCVPHHERADHHIVRTAAEGLLQAACSRRWAARRSSENGRNSSSLDHVVTGTSRASRLRASSAARQRVARLLSVSVTPTRTPGRAFTAPVDTGTGGDRRFLTRRIRNGSRASYSPDTPAWVNTPSIAAGGPSGFRHGPVIGARRGFGWAVGLRAGLHSPVHAREGLPHASPGSREGRRHARAGGIAVHPAPPRGWRPVRSEAVGRGLPGGAAQTAPPGHGAQPRHVRGGGGLCADHPVGDSRAERVRVADQRLAVADGAVSRPAATPLVGLSGWLFLNGFAVHRYASLCTATRPWAGPDASTCCGSSPSSRRPLRPRSPARCPAGRSASTPSQRPEGWREAGVDGCQGSIRTWCPALFCPPLWI